MLPPTSKIAPTPNGGALHAGDVTTLVRDVRPTFDALFSDHTHIVLAVSGGPDSMALLQLAALWRGGAPHRQLSAVTVNHGLRPEAADEADMVAKVCAQLGMPHTIMRLEGNKPQSGVQAWARDMRLDLFRRHLNKNGWSAVATAHTADDQAETLLMRLVRGSGLDGLGGMRAATSLGGGQVLLRPLLGVTKERLLRALAVWQCPWVEDASNRSTAFERVRIRRARAILKSEHVDLDSKALARTAVRLARANDALRHATSAAWKTRPETTLLHPHGWAEVDWPWLLEHPEDIRLRLLAGLLESVGGQRPISLGQLERHTIGRSWLPLRGTLNGVMSNFRAGSANQRIVLSPEFDPRRTTSSETTLSADRRFIWDGRFEIVTTAELQSGYHLAELGSEAAQAIHAVWLPLARHANAAAINRLPAIWVGKTLVSVPALRYAAHEGTALSHSQVTSRFLAPDFA